MATAPAPSKPKPGGGKRSLGARLTAKAGPLPVWAWAALILGAYLLCTRGRGGSANATTTATTAPASDTGTSDVSGGDTSGGVGSSGQPVDLSGVSSSLDANTSAIDALAYQLNSAALPNVDSGIMPGAVAQYGPASTPTSQPAVQTAAAGHLTQTTPGVLKWGGITFTTKAQFNQWAAAHGTTPAKEFASHPQAKAVYSTLR